MQILKAAYSEDEDSIMKRCAYARYLINVEGDIDVNRLNEYFDEMLTQGVIFERQKKNKKNQSVTKELNTRDLIHYLKAEKVNEKIRIMAVFKTQETGSMKVEEFIRLLNDKGFEFEYFTILKVDALDKEMKEIL
jgi:hypothetical protein